MLRSRLFRPALVVTAVLALLGFGITPSNAATPITVSTAIGRQDGSTASVTGYVVGQPTATNTVVRSNFPNDFALALADSATQTSTSSMLYVQIPTAFRASYGLQSNPGLIGQQITVDRDADGVLLPCRAEGGDDRVHAAAGRRLGPAPAGRTTDYYADAMGKTGAALKAALHTIISSQTKLSYGQVWNALKDTDQDPANTNNVILLYTGRSISKSAQRRRRRRLEPRARLGQVPRRLRHRDRPGHRRAPPAPRGRDGQLRPRQQGLRQRRHARSPRRRAATPTPTPSSPRDAVKGDVARMIFYMAVRYEGDDGFAEPGAQRLGRQRHRAVHRPAVGAASSGTPQDPPDAFEQRRNEVIYDQYQHNRNPFIDHPEWVTSIWP